MIIKEEIIIKRSKEQGQGSIAKAEKSELRRELSYTNKNERPLTGRIGYWYCDNCNDNTVHRIEIGTIDSTECIYCGIMVNLRKGDYKKQQVESFFMF